MKNKTLVPFFVIVLIATSTCAQGLLNKLKNKANQELNNLGNGRTQNSTLNKNKLSSNVTRTVAVSMASDETFDYQENCIDLGGSINQISFIVNKHSGGCYSYKNGIKTRVQCPTTAIGNNNCQTSLQCSYYQLRELPTMGNDEIKKYMTTVSESHKVQQPTVSDQQMKMMAAYMTPEQLAEVKKQMAEAQKQTAGKTYSTVQSQTILFNGKTYGPYKLVSKFYLTPDGKNFYAVVGESKGDDPYLLKNKIITSALGTELSLPENSMTTDCIASPNNSEFGYVTYDIAAQKNLIITSSGKKIEVPMGSKVWYSDTGNHVISFSQTQLYFDQQVIKTFANTEVVQPCDLFINPDGKGVSVVKNNTMSFADGDYYEYPLKIMMVHENGKSYFKWLALENQEVVVYQKPI